MTRSRWVWPFLRKPAHELVHRLPPLRGDAVVGPLEQPVHEDRQLVDGEHHRPVALGQGGEDLIPSLPPVPRVDPCPELDLDLGDGHRVDSIAGLSQGVGESGLDPRPGAPHRPRPGPDLGDGVGRGGGVLQVDEDRLEAALFLQAAQQLPDKAGLSHPPLGCQQGMRAGSNPLGEGLELDLPVEEPVPGDPVGSGFPEHGHPPSQRIRWQPTCWQRICWQRRRMSRGFSARALDSQHLPRIGRKAPPWIRSQVLGMFGRIPSLNGAKVTGTRPACRNSERRRTSKSPRSRPGSWRDISGCRGSSRGRSRGQRSRRRCCGTRPCSASSTSQTVMDARRGGHPSSSPENDSGL